MRPEGAEMLVEFDFTIGCDCATILDWSGALDFK